MVQNHAAVWLDHEQAQVFAVSRDGASDWQVRPHDRHIHLHNGDPDHAPTDDHYFHTVADALKDADEVLIVGPGDAKHALMRHLGQHDPVIAEKVMGVESMDRPDDGEFVKFARIFFRAGNRMR